MRLTFSFRKEQQGEIGTFFYIIWNVLLYLLHMTWTVSFTSHFVFKQCLSRIKDRTTTEVILPCPQHNVLLTRLELLSLFLPCHSPSIFPEFLWSEFCMFQVSCVLGTGGESPSPASSLPQPLPCSSNSFVCTHISLPPVVHRTADASTSSSMLPAWMCT